MILHPVSYWVGVALWSLAVLFLLWALWNIYQQAQNPRINPRPGDTFSDHLGQSLTLKEFQHDTAVVYVTFAEGDHRMVSLFPTAMPKPKFLELARTAPYVSRPSNPKLGRPVV